MDAIGIVFLAMSHQRPIPMRCRSLKAAVRLIYRTRSLTYTRYYFRHVPRANFIEVAPLSEETMS